MLRIIVERSSNSATMKLAGKLAGPWLEELDPTWADVGGDAAAEGVLLDLSEVIFVAPEGRERLESIYKQGGSRHPAASAKALSSRSRQEQQKPHKRT